MSTAQRASRACASIDAVIEKVYADGRVVADDGKVVPVFPSGVTRQRGSTLREIARAERASSCIETGFALGLGTLFLVGGMFDGGCESPRHVVVDPFQRSDWHGVGLKLVGEAGVADRVALIERDSLLALPAMVARGERFDMSFIDGGHHFENALCDILFAARLVRPSGAIVVDDTWMPAVRAAIAYATSNLGLEDHTPPDAGPEWKHLCLLRTPTHGTKRPWDHFVEFRG